MSLSDNALIILGVSYNNSLVMVKSLGSGNTASVEFQP